MCLLDTKKQVLQNILKLYILILLKLKSNVHLFPKYLLCIFNAAWFIYNYFLSPGSSFGEDEKIIRFSLIFIYMFVGVIICQISRLRYGNTWF